MAPSALVVASSATTAWVSAAVAVLGAAASIFGLVRYFADLRDNDDGDAATRSPEGGPGGETASEWTPVFHDDPGAGAEPS